MSNQQRRLLVTGLSGFVGQHIAQRATNGRLDGWNLAPEFNGDILDAGALGSWLREAQPDAIIHLAAQTFVPKAFAEPAATIEVNLLGTLNLLQALKTCGFNGSFLYVSSGDVYGQVDSSSLPIVETLPPRPQNPYAVSKAAAELLCYQWSRVEPWRIVIARPFNHIGTGQRPDFVIASIAQQIARIKRGLQKAELVLGDIDITRDFLDVDDVISAYLALLQHGQSGEIYNVCSGQEHSVRELIETMLTIAGVRAEIVRDPTRLRPADQRRVVGNNHKLRAATRWQPKPLEETLRAIVRDWEERDFDE